MSDGNTCTALTHAQEIFAREYAQHGNGARAAMAAYPRLKGTDAASERGRQTLRRARVIARIRELQGGVSAIVPPDTAEIERTAAIAFDTTAPDIVRLIALKAVTDALQRWAARYDAGTGAPLRTAVTVRILPDG